MLTLWYNGISVSHVRARAAQLYHIFNNLSIGNLHKNERRPFLQGLTLGNKVFSFVIVKQTFNSLAFCLSFTINIKNGVFANVGNVIMRNVCAF